MSATNTEEISVRDDFSFTPGPRYKIEGDYSGEEFRKLVLAPAVKNAIERSVQLNIVLDGTAGYGTSFLEESFGGLIREDGFEYKKLISIFTYQSNEEPELVEDINQYLLDAISDTAE